MVDSVHPLARGFIEDGGNFSQALHRAVAQALTLAKDQQTAGAKAIQPGTGAHPEVSFPILEEAAHGIFGQSLLGAEYQHPVIAPTPQAA